jgi:hypothetical protein
MPQCTPTQHNNKGKKVSLKIILKEIIFLDSFFVVLGIEHKVSYEALYHLRQTPSLFAF